MLTYLDLSVTRPEPRGDMADRYRLHQTLRRCFGDQHLLYRVNDDDKTVLVRSDDMGDFATLCEGYLRKTVEISREPVVGHGEVYKLALAANPVKCLSRGAGNRAGKRLALQGVGARLDWARTQLRNNGFDVIALEIVGSEWLQSPQGINVLAVEYRGVVVVTDTKLAQAAITQGIGRGKAWGLGMLLLT